MAAIIGGRVGRLSHGLRLRSAVPISLEDALQAVKETVQNDRLVRNLRMEPDTIWNAVVTLVYRGSNGDGDFNVWVPVGRRPLEQGDNLDSAIQYMRNRINNRLELMELRESGITVIGVREVRLWINAGQRMMARNIEGEGWVEIPDSLRRKQAVVNIQNTDRRCLIWCLCAFMLKHQGRLPARDLERVSHYQVDEYVTLGRKRIKTGNKTWMDVGLDFAPLERPNTKLADRLQEFEQKNDVGIYVYSWEEKDYGHGAIMCRARLCRTPTRLHKLECIVLQHRNHFVWVKNYQALMSCHGTSDVKTTRDGIAIKHCHRCGSRYRTQKLLDKHLETCDPWNLDAPDLKRKTYLPQPAPDGRAPTIHFKHSYQRHMVPLYVVADCETYREGDSNAHVASFAWAVVGSELYTVPEEFKYRAFIDQEGDSQVGCMVRGLRALIEEVYKHAKVMSQAYPLPQLSPEEEQEFRRATTCYLCDRPPCEKGLIREHCHWSGAYRGASCLSCNAKLVWKSIPVFFHNFAGFDHGPVVRALAELSAEYDHQLTPINKSSEKMISLKFGPLAFRDSLCLLSGSLSQLIDDFRVGVTDLAAAFPRMAERHPYRHVGLDLLLRKMPFPYSDLTDRSRLLPGYRIPDKAAFGNDIAEKAVDEAEWAAWQETRQRAGIHDWRGMHDLYLATDVLSLCDILEQFRTAMYEVTGGLDLLHNLTLPKASWIGALKKSKCRVELVCDEELFQAVEDGIRGGVCVPYQSHAVANDPRTAEYDPARPDSIIGYWDANSLYPWAMCQPLAVRGYRQLHDNLEETVRSRSEHFVEDTPTGLFVDVTIEVPEELHDELDLAPTRKGPVPGGKVTKLYPYLGRQRLHLHLPLLAAYMRVGVRLVEVHRVWEYEQTPFLRAVIEDLASIRAQALSESLKMAAKLAGNSLYGMCILNKAGWRTLALYTDAERWECDVANNHSPGLAAWCALNDEGCFLGYRERRMVAGVCLDSPRLQGSHILDWSKYRMWNFHYHCMKKICRPLLLYQDTDSFVYLLENCRDPYELMCKAPEWFDFKNGKPIGWRENENSSVPGYFKYEFIKKGTQYAALEYAGSEAKVYAMRLQALGGDQDEYIRCKGCPGHAAKRDVHFENVKAAALNQTVHSVEYNAIRMKSTKPVHIRERKVVMRGNNDKVLSLDGEWNRPLGHYLG